MPLKDNPKLHIPESRVDNHENLMGIISAISFLVIEKNCPTNLLADHKRILLTSICNFYKYLTKCLPIYKQV